MKKGHDIQCPGHIGCTATIPASTNIGDEKSGGRKLAQALINGIDPIKVGMLATDADGKMAQGFSTIMKESGVTTEHCLDTVHLNRLITRAFSNSKMKINLETKTKTAYLQLAYFKIVHHVYRTMIPAYCGSTSWKRQQNVPESYRQAGNTWMKDHTWFICNRER